MKTLIINGSPRKNGDTMYFINKIKESIECDVASAYHMDFSPCIDCRECTKGECIYKDEMTKLLNNIDNYDNIIVATPLYYNQPTGVLMAMMSRTQMFFLRGKKLKEKKGYVIVVGGGDSVINSADAEKTVRIMLMGLNVKVKGYVRCLHTSSVKPCNDTGAKEELNNIINELSEGMDFDI
ncbi:MAG: flavodoxin family protein [Clostridia bacterium]|nr:flavodoxin family protein [Clostridia bacterium]